MRSVRRAAALLRTAPGGCAQPSEHGKVWRVSTRRLAVWAVAIVATFAIFVRLAPRALAQDEDLDEVPIPPPPSTTELPSPVPPSVAGVPLDLLTWPLLAAAEADLGAGRAAVALARAAIVAEALPEGLPLRVRADGLRLLAMQRLRAGETAPAADVVLAPLIVQAEHDVRAGQLQMALARLDFALVRIPADSALATRARALRASISPGSDLTPPPAPVAAPSPATAHAEAPPAQNDGRRGTGEIVELYITAGAFGGLTGVYVSYLVSERSATLGTYTLTGLTGAALFAVGVLSLDLTEPFPSGVPPAISASIRAGLLNGVLALAMYESAVPPAADDPNLSFSLAWGGAAIGLATGLAVGFGLTPTVAEARFVESAGLWGIGLGTYVALLTEFRDGAVASGIALAGLDAGLIAGLVLAALELLPPVRRTLFMDLGFLIGSGVGALLPGLYYMSSNAPLEAPVFGVGMLIGSIGGWALATALTHGMAETDAPPVTLALSPMEGGAVVGMQGAL